MSSTPLYRQWDKTARNNSYTSHKVKNKIATDKDYAALDNSKTQLQGKKPDSRTQLVVKKPAFSATPRSYKKAAASRANTFVPIPELGIYTPDQHVLQNGTFAQHCHQREVKNRMSCASFNSVDNDRSNISCKSSCEKTGSGFGFQKKAVLRGFGSEAYRHKNGSSADIYHITNPQQQNHSVFNHQVGHNLDSKPVRNEMVTNNYGRVTNSVRSNRNLDNIKNDKMSPSARSHSLSDLSTGLTFSLIGQKKSDSVMCITDNSQVKAVGCSNSGRKNTRRGGSALRDIEERSTGTAVKCQDSTTSMSPLYSNSKLNIDQDEGSYKNLSGTSATNGYHQMIHQTKQNTSLEQPYQQKLQNQYFQQHKPQQQLQKEYSLSEENPHVEQHISFPRARKDSQDTSSSYTSALSDVRSFQDIDTQYNNRTNISAQTSDATKMTNKTVHPFSFDSAHNTISCSKDNDTSAKTPSVVNSQPLGREKSLVKPRRSLPNVPLNEASERIKRFTEMMKARMSANNSKNKNCLSESCISNYTPSRMSSTGSACSQMGHSMKSSSETPSSDVFVSANNNHCEVMPDHTQQNGFLTVHEVSAVKPRDKFQEEMCSPRKSSGYYSENDNGAKNADISVNRRTHIDEDVFVQSLDQRMNHNSMLEKNSDGFCHKRLNQNGWHGQCHNVLPYGEIPVAAADQSIDSGRTTETNNSYNGSVLDSGYTTNNDGENDSCRSHAPHPNHYCHNTHKEYSQHADQHNEISQSSANTHETEHCKYHHSHKYPVNLVHAQHFGSVQNVSSQSYRHSQDLNLLKGSYLFADDQHQHLASQTPVFCCKKISNKNISESIKNGSNQAGAVRSVLPGNQQQLHDLHMSANRRSWDCANDTDGFPSNQMKRYERANERYRSSDVLPSSKRFVDENYVNMHQTDRIHCNQYQPLKTYKQPINVSQNSVSDSEIAQLTGLKGFTPLMSQSCHSELKPGRDRINHHFGDQNHEHPQKSPKATRTDNAQFASGHHKALINDYENHHKAMVSDYENHHKATVNDYENINYYKLSNGSHKHPGEMKPQQVPASRVNRLTQGYTHPPGFGISESDCTFHQYSTVGQEMSLFHMTQTYDLSPVLINLPQTVVLKNMVELSELSVEMSLAGVPGLSSSLHGKAPQIGTPGSAFTPVKNSVDRDKPLTGQLNVMCFSSVWDDIHKYTTLGRVLKGDIVIEVNGWYCLGADVVHVRKFIENCKEAITLTVARLKESDDVRFKGQTAIERIKGLESEISRLDDLIQARDDKIKSMTVVTGTVKFHHTGTLSEINGKVPLEGMVIGCDEYVV